jgi:hypothetical protein
MVRTSSRRCLVAGLVTLAALGSSARAGAPPWTLVNDTPLAPALRATGGPLLVSDDPEYVAAPGITYEDTVRGPGWFRVFDYHVNTSGQPLYFGIALVDPRGAPVAVGLGRHAAVVSSSFVAAGEEVFARWLATAPSGAVVARTEVRPGRPFVVSQRVPAEPPGAVLSEAQYDFDVLGPGRIEVVAFAAPSPVPDLARLRVLPPRPGAVRGTYPHNTLVGTVHLGAGRATAVALFDVSGPAAGYTAPDDALPGESVLGWDAVDHRPVWSKGPYGFLYRLQVEPPPGASRVAVAVTTTPTTRDGAPHRGDGYVLRIAGHTVVRTGVYLPAEATVATVSGPFTVETTLPGGSSAPEWLILTPTGGHGAAPTTWDVYGWPSTDPRARRWIPWDVPASWRGLVLSWGAPSQAPWGFHPVLLFPGVPYGRHRVRIPGPRWAVACTGPAVIPFRVWRGASVVAHGAVHCMDFPPAPLRVGAWGGTLFAHGYGVAVLPGALSRPEPVDLTLPQGLPPLPAGWTVLGPPFALRGPAGVHLRRPAVLDADEVPGVDHAMALQEQVRLWVLAGGRWQELLPSAGSTPWDGGFDVSFWLPDFGTYALAAPAGQAG